MALKKKSTRDISWVDMLEDHEIAMLEPFVGVRALEDDLEGFMALTWTFKEKLEVYTPLIQLKRIVDALEFLRSFAEFYIFPEFTKQGRIHVHGFIKVTDRVNYIKRGCRGMYKYGFYQIKTIDNPMKWLRYCIKDIEIANRVFGERTQYLFPIMDKHIEDMKIAVDVRMKLPYKVIETYTLPTFEPPVYEWEEDDKTMEEVVKIPRVQRPYYPSCDRVYMPI